MKEYDLELQRLRNEFEPKSLNLKTQIKCRKLKEEFSDQPKMLELAEQFAFLAHQSQRINDVCEDQIEFELNINKNRLKFSWCFAYETDVRSYLYQLNLNGVELQSLNTQEQSKPLKNRELWVKLEQFLEVDEELIVKFLDIICQTGYINPSWYPLFDSSICSFK
jgi:hypothetical protein